MPKLHLSFRNIRVPVKDAALSLFERKPWRESPQEQEKIANEFVRAASTAYSVVSPEVIVDYVSESDIPYVGAWDYNPAEGVQGGDGIPSSIQAAQIVLRKWSITELFAAFRVHLLNNGVEPRENVPEPYGWAFSLFYSVKPVMFRARVRESRIGAVTEADLYSRNTLARGVAAGVVTEEGDILVSNFPKYLDELEAGTLTVESILSALSHEEDAEGDELEAQWAADAAIREEGDEAEVVPTTQTVGVPAIVDDGLDDLGIVDLRTLSRGVVSGGYSLRKPALIAALREAGVRAPGR